MFVTAVSIEVAVLRFFFFFFIKRDASGLAQWELLVLRYDIRTLSEDR